MFGYFDGVLEFVCFVLASQNLTEVPFSQDSKSCEFFIKPGNMLDLLILLKLNELLLQCFRAESCAREVCLLFSSLRSILSLTSCGSVSILKLIYTEIVVLWSFIPLFISLITIRIERAGNHTLFIHRSIRPRNLWIPLENTMVVMHRCLRSSITLPIWQHTIDFRNANTMVCHSSVHLRVAHTWLRFTNEVVERMRWLIRSNCKRVTAGNLLLLVLTLYVLMKNIWLTFLWIHSWEIALVVPVYDFRWHDDFVVL